MLQKPGSKTDVLHQIDNQLRDLSLVKTKRDAQIITESEVPNLGKVSLDQEITSLEPAKKALLIK